MATNPFPQPFGKYILLNKIALGGMAEIFRAKTIGAEGFEKEVVIKRILPHYTEDEAFVTMFIDEAKVSSGLNHPNIVQIYDFDTQDEAYYIAMEYIEGRDLRRSIDRGNKEDNPLTVPQVVHTVMEIAKGLHYAHTKTSKGEPLNIIHRDVSPQNVMISFDGEVKIMDFGIAKAAARSTKTRAGTVKGKCAYMSPEQARGKDLDPRSDLFAVGVIMWEMLTGRRLFAGETDFETLTNVLKADVPSARGVNPDVPEAVDAMLLKCLQRERDDRYSDCKEFLRDLENWYYPNVEDKEAAELGHHMRTLFAPDIAEMQAVQAEDAQTKFLEASEVVRAKRSGSSSGMQQAISNPDIDSISDTEAPTVALDAAAVKKAMEEAGVGVGTEDATVALDLSEAQTLKAPAPAIPAQKSGGSKAWLFIVLFFVLAGLGVGGYFAWPHIAGKKPEGKRDRGTSSTTAGKDPQQKPNKQAKVTLRAKPRSATITVGDLSKKGKLTVPSKIGESVVATFTLDGYETAERTIDVKTASHSVSVMLQKKAPPEPQEATVGFSVDPTDATIKVSGQTSTGSLEIKAKVGDELSALFTHPDYTSKVKDFTVTRDGQTVSVVLERKPVEVAQNAVLEIRVIPPEATLEVNGQPQPQTSVGQFSVQGYRVGDDLRIQLKLKGYKAKKDKLKLTSSRLSRTYELSKVVVATGPGVAKFNARPWANVKVGSKGCRVPCTLRLPSGRHSARFTHPSLGTKRKGFTIRPNRTTSIVVDMR